MLQILILLLVNHAFASFNTSTPSIINLRSKRCYNETKTKSKSIENQDNINNNLIHDQMQFPPIIVDPPEGNTNVSAWKCCCWNATNEGVIECRCEGMGIMRIPQTIQLPVQKLTIISAGIRNVRKTGLKIYSKTLIDISLTDMMFLEGIADGAFANLTLLRTIYISHAPRLAYLTKDVFSDISENIKIIRIINSGLIRIPDFGHFPPATILHMLDFDNNKITFIAKNSVKVKSDQLILANNALTYIESGAFYGSQIARLSLRENPSLTEIHPHAFSGLSMQSLDLSGTAITRLPSEGLHEIEELFMEDATTMKTIPSIYNFKNLQRAFLTHSFHCCAFKFPSRHNPQRHAEQMSKIQEWQKRCGKDKEQTTTAYRFNVQEKNNNSASSIEDPFADITDFNQTNDMEWQDTVEENGFFHDGFVINPGEDISVEYCGNFSFRNFEVDCFPLPNAMNPCEDVMGYKWLRIAVWLVVSLAIFGNISVLVVIFSVRSENLTVPRFLMCNLAFADLCLGLYLLLIACMDAYSIGEYFNYAYDWQYGVGCKVTGFLTVFASHLSVFTLTIITIERWLAITYALHLNRRLTLRPTIKIMMCGWIYSILMSMLPLFGISNYSSTSICLPMENSDLSDTLYLITILGVNGLTFFIITLCYAHIYFSLEKKTRQCSQPGEMTIAKKMSLLVFTNFFCWAPIAFFGLTALAGFPLIDVTKSKILLVFFYPLNSCADPYLYAILTSQYRKDLVNLISSICKRKSVRYKQSISLGEVTRLTDNGESIRRNSRKESLLQELNENKV